MKQVLLYHLFVSLLACGMLGGLLLSAGVAAPAIKTPVAKPPTSTPHKQPQPAPAEPMPKPVKEAVNPKDGAVMVWVPAGEFLMGTSPEGLDALLKANTTWKAVWFADEMPQHRVRLDGYWIYKCEVTVAQYRQFCKETGREMPKLYSWSTDTHPMVNVCWDDAVAYTKWAGVRLPTEAEWEKAARGTDGRYYPWGTFWDKERSNNYASSYQDLGKDKNGKERKANKTAPVGAFPSGASPYGVQDMAGNAWEWCADWYSEDYYRQFKDKIAINPQGPEDGDTRVMRGGAWGSYAITVRVTNRNSDLPELTYVDSGGFRCAVSDETGAK